MKVLVDLNILLEFRQQQQLVLIMLPLLTPDIFLNMYISDKEGQTFCKKNGLKAEL